MPIALTEICKRLSSESCDSRNEQVPSEKVPRPAEPDPYVRNKRKPCMIVIGDWGSLGHPSADQMNSFGKLIGWLVRFEMLYPVFGVSSLSWMNQDLL